MPPQEGVPISPTTWYILQSLTEGPKHGYRIGKEVERLSEGEVKLAIGNLYTHLARLVEQRLIEPIAGQEDGRRKLYRLTTEGEVALEVQRRRLVRMLSTAKRLRPAFRT